MKAKALDCLFRCEIGVVRWFEVMMIFDDNVVGQSTNTRYTSCGK